MAIDDLPLPVVNFLNVIGVPWPYVNEDTVTQFATLVREFRQAVQTPSRSPGLPRTPLTPRMPTSSGSWPRTRRTRGLLRPSAKMPRRSLAARRAARWAASV
jgi:hypothetical protein